MKRQFPRVLQEVMDEQGHNQVDMARLTGLEQVTISRLLRAASRPDRNHLTAILTAFSDPADKYRIVYAYIQDELPEEILSQLDIQPSTLAGLREQPPVLPANLPPRVERALTYLLHEIKDNSNVGDVFVDLANALGWTDPGKTHSKVVKYPAPKRETIKRKSSSAAN